MATPEQNTLLMMQIGESAFRPLAERRLLQQRLAEMQREEQFKRELQADATAKAIQLAQMQADREDARWTAADTREGKRWEAQQKLEAAKEKARAETESGRQSARDKADLLNEFDKTYPVYAEMMLAAELPAKKREEFPETRAGLGQMVAEASAAKRAYEDSKLKRAAKGGAGNLMRLQTQLEETDQRIAELSQPTEDDQKIARSRAFEAVKNAVTKDVDGSYSGMSEAQKKKGFTALSAGNTTEAAKYLGQDAVDAFDAQFAQTLMGLPNMKTRMAEMAQERRNQAALKARYDQTFQAYASAGGTNPFVNDEMERMLSIQRPTATKEPKAKKRTLDEVFGAPAAGAAAPGAVRPAAAAPPTSSVAPKPANIYDFMRVPSFASGPATDSAVQAPVIAAAPAAPSAPVTQDWRFLEWMSGLPRGAYAAEPLSDRMRRLEVSPLDVMRGNFPEYRDYIKEIQRPGGN